MIEDEKNGFLQNAEKVKLSAMHIEEQVLRKEQIMKLKGGYKKNPEELQIVSDLKVDSLKAKLALLENVTKK